MRVSRKFNSLFILYISTAKPISLVRGYIEVKVSNMTSGKLCSSNSQGGVLPYKEVGEGGGLELTSGSEAKFGAKSVQFTK